jgi:multidrug transporter EmrE-like cation transporter
VIIVFLLANMVVNTAAHLCFKLSAGGKGFKKFLFWQVLGNLGAFLGVLAYTAVMRDVSLHVAYPLTQGLTAIGVQVIASRLVLKERIKPAALVGTGVLIAGIALVSL